LEQGLGLCLTLGLGLGLNHPVTLNKDNKYYTDYWSLVAGLLLLLLLLEGKMRIPTYLSPTSLGIWKADREQYYLQYLSENRPPRPPQTEPMSVGSAFDAHVKSYLYGKDGPLCDVFDFTTLFEAQVDPANRDFALVAGKECMDVYRSSGALSALEKLIGGAAPRFEFTVEGTVNGVPLLGKPDIYFTNDDGINILLDWKVNGYCGGGRSPTSGYTELYYADGTRGGSHKKAQLFKLGTAGHGGASLTVNGASTLDMVDKSWATQLATYGWLCGEPVGSDFVVALDQIYRTRGGGNRLAVATHRCYIGCDFQKTVISEYSTLWEIINSGYIFRDMTKEESWSRQTMLDQVGDAYDGDDELTDFLREMR